jgi:RimJ/RimL family protein N-acetyltransferase
VTDDPWTMPPTLCGRRVVLRPMSMADASGLAQAHDDVDTLLFFPYGIESEPPSEHSVAHALQSGRQTLTQVDAQTGTIIGTTALYNMSKLHGRVTVGYTWLSSTVRGTAVNAESKLLVLEHIFSVLGARRVEFNVDDQNVRSRAAVLAIGAIEEGALRNHARRRDGSWRTTIVYSIIDSEWGLVRARLQARIQSAEA